MTFRDLAYARISNDDQHLGRGVGRQTADLRRHSQATGGELVHLRDADGEMVDVLIDNDQSASRYAKKKRRNYPLLVDAARAGLGDRILIYRMDRLLRLPSELEELITLCEERRIPVVNMNGAMDLTTAEGRKAARDRVADAAFESDLISERTRRGHDELAALGRPHGSTGKNRCFGYEADGLTIREDEAEVIRRAAADVLAAGTPINEIARRWNTAGHRGRRGSPWKHRTVMTLLTGHRIAGLRVHRKGTDEETVYPAAWPAIIDEITHRALRRKLIDQAAPRPGRRTECTGLFVAVIDGVARPMRRDTWANSGGAYRTRPEYPSERHRSIQIGPIAEVEALVREWLFDYVESGAFAEAIAKHQQATPTGAVESVSDVEAEIVQLAEDEADKLITRPEWLAKRKRLLARLERAQAAEAAAPRATEVLPVDIRARWETWDVDRRAAALREVFDRIEVAPATRLGPGLDPSRLTPIWRY